MRWRQILSLAAILIPAALFTVACADGLHPDPHSSQFIDSRRDP